MDLPNDLKALPHDNQAYILISVAATVLSIASLSAALRIYTRACLLKQVGADDYLALLALALTIATGVSECVHTKHGLGKHSWDLQPDEVVAYLKNFYVNIALYNAGLMVIKLTFLTQYYRVLVLKRFQTVCIVAMITVGAWSLSQLLVGLFICTPIAGFWDAALNPKCIPVPLQWYINAGGNIASDIVVFVLPLPVLAHLKLPRVQRLPLVAIFSLGFFTCAISVIRVKFLEQGGDFSYENIEASIWSITELVSNPSSRTRPLFANIKKKISCSGRALVLILLERLNSWPWRQNADSRYFQCSGVTCVCLPTLRPLVSKYVPILAGTMQRSSVGYLRQSPSPVTDVGEGGKHIRQGSKESNGVGIGSQEELRRPNAPFDADIRTSGDTSDGIIGLYHTRESLSGDHHMSPTRPDPTYIRPQARAKPSMRVSWIQPGVTTTISTGNKESVATHGDSSTIYITRDIMMQEIPPSEL